MSDIGLLTGHRASCIVHRVLAAGNSYPALPCPPLSVCPINNHPVRPTEIAHKLPPRTPHDARCTMPHQAMSNEQ